MSLEYSLEDNFSLRIVVADFYTSRPISGLDPCYSEFRGHEIKTVPVIRIFGSDKNGGKCCMHVHGVFPYFYIPYETKTHDTANSVVYQIAKSIDKAVNISLGQTNSHDQHVFKIQLVKGIPFYGYHRKESKFLKIYLYNPKLVKKVANLLQNGAIIGKIFQPHESHVPFILQFLIDYNLYGMSFLHVPLRTIKYRRDLNEESLSNLRSEQIINIPRISTSHHEIDISASFILNRFEINGENSKRVLTKNKNEIGNCSNPGIAAIWKDEKIRRQQLSNKLNEGKIPSLEIPESQERENAISTESDIFYRTALKKKLQNKNFSLNDSIANETVTENSTKKTTFDLKKVLQNSVYPEECSQEEESLINASLVLNHLSENSTFSYDQGKGNKSLLNSEITQNKDILSDEGSIDVNEDLVLSLSQNKLNQSLQGQDYELLDIMKQLEEDQNNETIVEVIQELEDAEDEHVDLDSTLAPLLQPSKVSTITKGEIDGSVKLFSEEYADEEKDTDYTVLMEDIDDILLQISQSSSIDRKIKESVPQLDGGNDLLYSPRRLRIIKDKEHDSPKTTPRKNRISRYAPLNVCAVKSPRSCVKQEAVIVISSEDEIETISNKFGLNKNVNLNSSTKNGEQQTGKQSNEFKSNATRKNLEKTFITCNLRPRKPKKTSQGTETALKTCGIKENKKSIEVNQSSRAKQQNLPIMKKCKVKLKRLKSAEVQRLSRKKSENTISEKQPVRNKRNRSPCDVAREYDRMNNFFPEPGPSHINYYKYIDLPCAKRSKNTTHNQDNIGNGDSEENYNMKSVSALKDMTLTPKDSEDELNIHSFYEKSLFIDSPLAASEISLTVTNEDNNEQMESEINCKCNLHSNITSIGLERKSCLIITPKDLPPNPVDIKKDYEKYNIFQVINVQPFYSNSKDVSTSAERKEIGHTILKIPGYSLNDCEEFSSLISDLEGLYEYRKKCLYSMGGTQFLEQFKANNNCIKEYLANEHRTIITTKNLPPTNYDARVWLKARKLIQLNSIEGKKSPIKVRKEKPKLILLKSAAANDDNDEYDVESLNDSLKSLSPMTPKNVVQNKRKFAVNGETPPSSSASEIFSINNTNNTLSIGKKYKRRQSLTQAFSRTCLQRKLEKLIESGDYEDVRKYKENSTTAKEHLKDSTYNGKELKSSQDKIDSFEKDCRSDEDSIKTEIVKHELEKSSYIRHLNLSESNSPQEYSFGINGPSIGNPYGFKMNLENLQTVRADVEYNYLTTITMEVFVSTRGNLNPDPEYDSINCVFFSVLNCIPNYLNYPSKLSGFIINTSFSAGNEKKEEMFYLKNDKNVSFSDIKTDKIIKVETELDIIKEIVNLCRAWDPDILAGYEIEMNSWGYVIERSKKLGLNLTPLLSRVPTQKIYEHPITGETSEKNNRIDDNEDRDRLTDLEIETKLCGRILLDVWRLMRSEIALTSYTFESVSYHVLHRRYPKHTYEKLTEWYKSPLTRWITLEYYLSRVNGTIEILEQLDLLGRTSEMAKIIGIQFYEVLSRGSQFRVESMMLRTAKPKNIVALSPSVQQRAHMRAPEYLQLILEPKSRFYVDPIIVLDFQSLYPSIIIAYNYCFSTCLGRVEHLGQSEPFEFGASQLRVSPSVLEKLIETDSITASPCGAVFVKNIVREGILPRMLQEILNTRLMVKQSMKMHKGNSDLEKVLHSRQLALKLMANVTYGYTAANFSGRMPCVEVGDSVVSKGRETLERAIKLVEANEKWKVQVVYGDTDSLFVLVPGRSREDAFKIGAEIAEAVTQDNPKPVKLKLEKVYQPSLLQTKKRYVGYMYETPDQENPIYEAKGIETVRRDGCPVVVKMLEKCIRILFESKDISQVKEYVCRQFTKLLTGRANVQDLIFAKEFRGRNGYKPRACVPALELTKKWLQTDPRAEPRRGERVPFLIVNGPPGLPLIRLVRSPHEYLQDEGLKINSIYYITKAIIPALNRCFLLIGVDINEWFAQLPRKSLMLPKCFTNPSKLISSDYSYTNLKKTLVETNDKKSTISQYFSSTNCVIDCGRQTTSSICSNCMKDPPKCITVLKNKISKLERNYSQVLQICQNCCSRKWNTDCNSLDCPVLFILEFKRREYKQIHHFNNMISEYF